MKVWVVQERNNHIGGEYPGGPVLVGVFASVASMQRVVEEDAAESWKLPVAAEDGWAQPFKESIETIWTGIYGLGRHRSWYRGRLVEVQE